MLYGVSWAIGRGWRVWNWLDLNNNMDLSRKWAKVWRLVEAKKGTLHTLFPSKVIYLTPKCGGWRIFLNFLLEKNKEERGKN